MSNTCYAYLTGSSLNSIGPPAQVQMSAQYSIVDTVTNTAVPTSSGSYGGTVDVSLNCPVASQQAVIPAVQAAIQAKESATPALTFIWLGL